MEPLPNGSSNLSDMFSLQPRMRRPTSNLRQNTYAAVGKDFKPEKYGLEAKEFSEHWEDIRYFGQVFFWGAECSCDSPRNAYSASMTKLSVGCERCVWMDRQAVQEVGSKGEETCPSKRSGGMSSKPSQKQARKLCWTLFGMISYTSTTISLSSTSDTGSVVGIYGDDEAGKTLRELFNKVSRFSLSIWCSRTHVPFDSSSPWSIKTFKWSGGFATQAAWWQPLYLVGLKSVGNGNHLEIFNAWTSLPFPLLESRGTGASLLSQSPR